MGKRRKGRGGLEGVEQAGDAGGGEKGGKRPQDKGRHVHPAETSSWQEEVKHFEYKYTHGFRVVPPYKVKRLYKGAFKALLRRY